MARLAALQARPYDGRRRQVYRDRGPAAGRRRFGPAALGRGGMRYGPQAAGVETPGEAIALAREIAASKGLQFAGFMLYPTEPAGPRRRNLRRSAGRRPCAGLDATMV